MGELLGKKVYLVYSEKYLGHIPPVEHPEKPSRIVTAYESLSVRGIRDKVTVEKPTIADEKLLTLVHAPEYIESIRELSKSGGGFLDADTYVSHDTFEVALYAVGGVIRGVDLVLEDVGSHAFALIRPPGHHVGFRGRALRAPSQGFCIFNNVAIATRYLQNRGYEKVAIVDIDCHHGNGTQEVFLEDSDVLFISIHQDPETLYPGTGRLEEVGVRGGEGLTVNLPLPPGSGDDVYLMVFREVVEPILREYSPEAILVSAGYDSYKGDPLGDLYLSSNCYWEVFSTLSEISSSIANGRLVSVLEGGYGQGLSRGFPSSIAGLLGLDFKLEPPTVSRSYVRGRVEKLLREARRLLSRWWASLG